VTKCIAESVNTSTNLVYATYLIVLITYQELLSDLSVLYEMHGLRRLRQNPDVYFFWALPY
jgi:hypothetical protein